jgi:hypothetical protein
MLYFRGLTAFSAFVYFTLITAVMAVEKETAARPFPTPRQWKIIAALDEATEVNVANQPLSDVIDFLTQKHEIEIQLDTKALTDAGVGTDTPITETISGVTLHSLLRLVLGSLDLTYFVGDGYLMITSKTEAENMLSTRVYPVQDLVTLDSEFRPPLAPGEKAGVDFQSLIEVITSAVAMTTWNDVGGPGSIKGFDHAHAIAVSQTEEVHEEIVELLANLRRTRDKQPKAAKLADPVAGQQHATDKQPSQIRVYRLRQPETAEKPATAATAAAPKEAAASPEKPAEAKAAGNTASVGKGPSDSPATGKLDAWAEAIAQLIPRMIEPESWQSGEVMVQAVGETIVVRQTDDVQHRIGKLINQILPQSVPDSMLVYYPAVRLSPPAFKANWPHEAEPQPRHVEARINAALDEPCELDFAEQPLSDVMDKLGEAHHVRIHLDSKALTDAGVGSDTPITRSITGVSLRTALKLLLSELDLTYLIRHEVLMITSKTEAENMLTTKVYPVFDLVVRSPDAPPSVPALNFRSLIDNITANLAPTTWDEVGGPGAILSFTNAGALVISQTMEVHEEIVEYLRALREVGAEQK